MKLSYVGEGFISVKMSFGDALFSCVMGFFLQSYLRTTSFSTFVHVKPWMAATATLPSARRHWHQTAMHQTALLKTAKVRTALSPCERHADVSPFGWVIQKCLNGSTAVHSGLQRARLATEIQSVLTMQGQSELGSPAVDEDQKNNFFCKGVS